MFAHTNWHRLPLLHYQFTMSIRSIASLKEIIEHKYRQKQLFGPVIRQTKKKSIGDSDKPGSSLSKESASKAAEAYWTVRRPHSNAQISPAKPTPAKQAIESPQQSTPYSRQTQQQSILFDDNGLNAIAKYPIYGPKAQLDQMQQLLYNSNIRLPSVSRILQATMSDGARTALKKWKLDKINEIGYAGFQLYQREILETGKQFHMTLEQYLTNGEAPHSDSPVIKLWNSVNGHLVELNPQAVLIEKPIVHTQLKYLGIIDNVSIVSGELCALEWKTSEKAKLNLNAMFDAPIQLCAYLGALNSDPRYDVIAKNGYVVVAYKNGDAGKVFKLSSAQIERYWQKWLERLHEYWIRVRDNTLPEPI